MGYKILEGWIVCYGLVSKSSLWVFGRGFEFLLYSKMMKKVIYILKLSDRYIFSGRVILDYIYL